jgi:hypothetical protein
MSTIPGTDLTVPADYYNRHDDAAHYDEHLLIAGRIGQSAEINEIQSRVKARIKGLGDHLLKDGDIKSGGDIIVTSTTGGIAQIAAEAAEIWLDGAERSIPARSFGVPATGTIEIGVWLLRSIVDYDVDPSLRDPAIGLRLSGEPGAARLKVQPTWGHAGDGQAGEFYAVHRLVEGVLLARSQTPESNAVATAIARYDRQSTGGSYVVSGFRLTATPDGTELAQTYALSAGTARVAGIEIIASGGQYIQFEGLPDVETIDEERYDSDGTSGQTIKVRHGPIAALNRVSVTKSVVEESVTRSVNANDPLSKTSVIAVSEVKQGGTTYVAGVNYSLSNDGITWLSGGPTTGTTYTVSFTYAKNVTSTATISADNLGVVIPETNVSGANLIEIGYDYSLPRIDRICIDTDGQWRLLRGISARFGSTPAVTEVPSTMLGIASIYQTWIPGARRVINDAEKVVSMARLEAHDRDIQTLYQLISANNLSNDLAAFSAREPLGRRGIFVDPLLNDLSRDIGVTQTAQITGGTLTLGVSVTVTDVSLPGLITLAPSGFVHRVEQPLSSSNMQINPYLVYLPVASYADLSPSFDYYAEDRESILDPAYVDVYRYRYGNPHGWTPELKAEYKEVGYIREKLIGEESTGETITTTRTEDARYMRGLSVNFTLRRWSPSENLVTVKIDGREVDFAERDA